MDDDSTQDPFRIPSATGWRKSTFSTSVECVVVSEQGDRIAVRNSNDVGEATLGFDRSGMAAWIAGCRAGEFDHLSR